MLVKSKKRIIKDKIHENLLLERDPVKILMENGDVQLLVDVETSIVSHLQNTFNFIPNVYCSESAYQLLQKEGMIS